MAHDPSSPPKFLVPESGHQKLVSKLHTPDKKVVPECMAHEQSYWYQFLVPETWAQNLRSCAMGLTVDGEMNPRSVDADVVAAVKEQHRAFVPTVVRHPDVRQFDRRLADRTYAPVER